jgi:stringent starvation protein B
MSPQQPLPPKKEVALALLERASVFVHLDPRVEGVAVPPWFKRQFQLVLQIGLNMAVPIPDLDVDDTGIRCTLSFNRSPFLCMLPWKAVYAMVGDDGRAMVWPDDIPPEVAAQAKKEPPKPGEKPKEQGRPTLEVLKHGEAKAPEKAPTKKREPKKKSNQDERATPRASAKAEPIDSTPPEGPKAPSQVGSPKGAPSRPGQKKPKREIPPYLRVVK